MKIVKVNGCRELLTDVSFKDVFSCLRNYFLHCDYLLFVFILFMYCIIYMFNMNKILKRIYVNLLCLGNRPIRGVLIKQFGRYL